MKLCRSSSKILKNGTSLKEERLVDSLGHTNPHRGKGTSNRRPPKRARQHQQKPPSAAAGTNRRCSRCGKARTSEQEDSTSRQLITFCQQGWPDRPHLKGDLSPYWHVRGDLALHDNLLLYGSRIVVPKSLQASTLQKIHNGHQGIQRCR